MTPQVPPGVVMVEAALPLSRVRVLARPVRAAAPAPSRHTLVGLRGLDADARIRTLVHARSLLRPRLGALALVLVQRRRFEPLGFRSLGDYSRERLGTGARVLREWARVKAALEVLPQLRTAVLEGTVSWSVARRVVALATPETDAACLESVRNRTVRAVEAMLHAIGAPPAPDARDETRIRVAVPLAHEALPRWHEALELARHMAGETLPVWECVEAIAAETLATLGAAPGAPDADADSDALDVQDAGAPETLGATASHPGTLATSVSPAGLRLAAAGAGAGAGAPSSTESGLRHAAFPALRWSAPRAATDAADAEASLAAVSRFAAEATPHALDTALREAVADLQRIDHDLGALLRIVLEQRLHRELGFDRFARYVEERADLSPRTARRWIRLARAGPALAAVATAFREGRVSGLQVGALAKVTIPESAPAWLALARSVTLRRLEEEVASVCRAGSSVSFLAPPEVATVFLAALDAARAHLSDGASRPAPASEALHWMLEHAIAAWQQQGDAFHDYADFGRDGWRCTVPGCTARRNLQSHHIVFRSHAGPDEPWNRTTLCAFHHHRGIHARLVACRGRAPDGLEFALGLRSAGPPLLRARSGDVLLP